MQRASYRAFLTFLLLSLSFAWSCGQAPIDSVGPADTSTSQDIVNGTSDSGDAAVAYLVITDPAHSEACTGTFISRTTILTARHCLQSFKQSPTTFIQISTGGPSPTYLITSLWWMQDETIIGAADGPQDLALVFINPPAGTPAPLPIYSSKLPLNQAVTLVGYGQPSPTGSPGTKRKGTSRVSQYDSYDDYVTATGTTEGCFGDSGGPLLVAQGSGFAVSGVLYGSTDANCTSTIYTNLSDTTNTNFERYLWGAANSSAYCPEVVSTSVRNPFTGASTTIDLFLVSDETTDSTDMYCNYIAPGITFTKTLPAGETCTAQSPANGQERFYCTISGSGGGYTSIPASLVDNGPGTTVVADGNSAWAKSFSSPQVQSASSFNAVAVSVIGNTLLATYQISGNFVIHYTLP